MTNPGTSMLTITLNCIVAGIFAGILFSIFLCALVLLIAGGEVKLTQQQDYDVITGLTSHTNATHVRDHRHT